MEVFQNPTVLICVLIMPLVIIGLAKALQRFRAKACADKANKEQ